MSEPTKLTEFAEREAVVLQWDTLKLRGKPIEDAAALKWTLYLQPVAGGDLVTITSPHADLILAAETVTAILDPEARGLVAGVNYRGELYAESGGKDHRLSVFIILLQSTIKPPTT